MGILGLDNLVAFAKEYQVEAQKISMNSTLPFAITGINITHVLRTHICNLKTLMILLKSIPTSTLAFHEKVRSPFYSDGYIYGDI